MTVVIGFLLCGLALLCLLAAARASEAVRETRGTRQSVEGLLSAVRELLDGDRPTPDLHLVADEAEDQAETVRTSAGRVLRLPPPGRAVR